MPVLFEIRNVNNLLLIQPEPAQASEARYVRNYHSGELSSLICGQCLVHDTGGVIHLVQDPWLIQLVNNGVDVSEVLSEETAAAGLLPEEEPVSIPFTTKKGHMGKLALRHTFPEEPIIYN